MDRYTVSLYDKDNDYFCSIVNTDEKDYALQVGSIVGLLLKNKDIIVRRNDSQFGITKDEPFDWVDVFDNVSREVVQTYTIL